MLLQMPLPDYEPAQDLAPLSVTWFLASTGMPVDLFCKSVCSPSPQLQKLASGLKASSTCQKQCTVAGVHSNTTDSRRASCSQNCHVAKKGLSEQVEHEAALFSRFVTVAACDQCLFQLKYTSQAFQYH